MYSVVTSTILLFPTAALLLRLVLFIVIITVFSCYVKFNTSRKGYQQVSALTDYILYSFFKRKQEVRSNSLIVAHKNCGTLKDCR